MNRFVACAMLVAANALACGAEVPAGGAQSAKRPPGPRVVPRHDPADIIPADLDLCVRIDLARMRAGLGQDAAERLANRTLPSIGEEVLQAALREADVVWVALRVADITQGDRVVVVEGKFKDARPDPSAWKQEKTDDPKVILYDRIVPGQRTETARIVSVDGRSLAFVTPVEIASVARVLRDGPDDKRGDPAAEGLVSMDLRARRLPALVERRFPSISAIVAGIDRVRGAATLADDGARIEADVTATSPEAAAKALKFLMALRDNVQEPRYVDALSGAHLERVGSTVQLRWHVPSKAVLGLLSEANEPPSAPPP